MVLRSWGWFIIIQKTRPLVGQMNPEQELAELENKVKEVFGSYQEALDVTKQLEAEGVNVKEEIGALTKQLEAEQGNLSVYQDRQAKAAGQKAKCENELVSANNVLKNEIDARLEASEITKSMNGEVGVIKKEIEDLELALQRLEQEKTNRDHQIRGLNDEVAQNDEAINKLNKEKKHIGDTQAKSSDDLQAAEEKQRRKVEGELKMAQETVTDLENAKRELEGAIARKEKDIMGLNSKLDDEQSVVAKMQKTIKETQGRVEEYEEELESERQARAKAERQR